MASKTAIGRMTNDALNRIQRVVGVLQVQFGVTSLDLALVRDRDPQLQYAKRLMALADWLEDLSANLGESGIDLSGAERLSNQLGLIRFVLDLALNEMTVKKLETLCADLNLEFKGQIKQEYVNELVGHLTGEPVHLVDLNALAHDMAAPDAPDADSDAETPEEVPEDEDVF